MTDRRVQGQRPASGAKKRKRRIVDIPACYPSTANIRRSSIISARWAMITSRAKTQEFVGLCSGAASWGHDQRPRPW